MASLANSSDAVPSMAARGRPVEIAEFWQLLAITAILFGIQSSASLSISSIDLVIPFAFSALIAAIPFLYYIRTFKAGNSIPILLYLMVVLLTNALSYSSFYASSYLIGPAQLTYSLVISVAIYFMVCGMRASVLQTWCMAITVAITLLSVAELNSSVSFAFTGVTEFLTANADLGSAFNTSDARDMTLHGAVRSKVFATEPSHVALTLMALGFGLFWTKPRFKLIVTWMALIVVCIWTIRSPILVATLLLGPAFSLVIRERQVRVMRLLVGMILLLTFAFVIADYILVIFGSRIEADGTGDGSFDMRFTVPFQFMADFLPGHLLYGVGVVGDFEMLTYEILAAYHERGITYVDYYNASFSLSNNFVQHFISFGLLFGIVALVALVFVARMQSGWAWVIVCTQFLTIWMFLGGYVSARVWVLCALILAIARRSEHDEATFALNLRASKARFVA